MGEECIVGDFILHVLLALHAVLELRDEFSRVNVSTGLLLLEEKLQESSCFVAPRQIIFLSHLL